LCELAQSYDLEFHLKPVFPLAVSDPEFFGSVNPLFVPYLLKDTKRTAKRLNIPYQWPRPDPIVMDMETRTISADQPYIRRLSCLAQVAADRGRGLEFVASVSALLYNPDIERWDTGSHLADAIDRAGMNLDELDEMVKRDAESLEAKIISNRKDQLAAGHWGAPLFDFDGEIFFGQDRIEDLVWHLKNNGLSQRSK
jgi:2-hydroxychromene-2-carboxylate isomerase